MQLKLFQINSSQTHDSSYRLNTLGPLCLWQCFLDLQVLHFVVKTALFLFSFMTHFTFSSCLIRYQFWRNLEWPGASFILMHFAAECHQLKPKPAQVWRTGRHFASLRPIFEQQRKRNKISWNVTLIWFYFDYFNLIWWHQHRPKPAEVWRSGHNFHLSISEARKQDFIFLKILLFVGFLGAGFHFTSRWNNIQTI